MHYTLLIARLALVDGSIDSIAARHVVAGRVNVAVKAERLAAELGSQASAAELALLRSARATHVVLRVRGVLLALLVGAPSFRDHLTTSRKL